MPVTVIFSLPLAAHADNEFVGGGRDSEHFETDDDDTLSVGERIASVPKTRAVPLIIASKVRVDDHFPHLARNVLRGVRFELGHVSSKQHGLVLHREEYAGAGFKAFSICTFTDADELLLLADKALSPMHYIKYKLELEGLRVNWGQRLLIPATLCSDRDDETLEKMERMRQTEHYHYGPMILPYRFTAEQLQTARVRLGTWSMRTRFPQLCSFLAFDGMPKARTRLLSVENGVVELHYSRKDRITIADGYAAPFTTLDAIFAAVEQHLRSQRL